MSAPLEQFIADLERLAAGDAAPRAQCIANAPGLRSASAAEVEQVLIALGRLAEHDEQHDEPLLDDALVAAIGQALWFRGGASQDQPSLEPLSAPAVDQLGRLYAQLGPASRARHHLLRALAADASIPALKEFAERVAADPPQRAAEADLAFVPLLQRAFPAAVLFPRLLDALEYPAVAALVLDVANYATRRKLLPRHPAAVRAARLAELLGGLVQRLRHLEENPRQYANTSLELNRTIADSIALVVSLSDALALIGDQSIVGKLYQALELSHRRVRTEAAAALARLGEDVGIDTLVQLAAEPVVRSRVLAYLEELNLLERVPDVMRTPQARAEGELSAWLAEPLHFGLPPQSLMLVDACRQYWPGFDEPVDCYLFQYDYHLPQGSLSGVGIVGPVTYSLFADLADLPPADIYAAYAGWQAEHAEIHETSAEELDAQSRDDFDALAQHLALKDYTDVQLVKVGSFFGQQTPVFTAKRQGRPALVVEGQEIHWFPASGRPPLGPNEAYSIIKGRQLLRAFNPREGEAPAEP